MEESPDKTEEQPEAAEQPLHPFDNLEDAPVYYIDAANFYADPFTLTVICGNRGTSLNANVVIPQKASVILKMSPQFGFRLAELFGRMQNFYEQQAVVQEESDESEDYDAQSS